MWDKECTIILVTRETASLSPVYVAKFVLSARSMSMYRYLFIYTRMPTIRSCAWGWSTRMCLFLFKKQTLSIYESQTLSSIDKIIKIKPRFVFKLCTHFVHVKTIDWDTYEYNRLLDSLVVECWLRVRSRVQSPDKDRRLDSLVVECWLRVRSRVQSPDKDRGIPKT